MTQHPVLNGLTMATQYPVVSGLTVATRCPVGAVVVMMNAIYHLRYVQN